MHMETGRNSVGMNAAKRNKIAQLQWVSKCQKDVRNIENVQIILEKIELRHVRLLIRR